MQLYEHQIKTRDHVLRHKTALVLNDPGTGKTASLLDAIRIHRKENGGGRALVLAPKAILEPAWVADCRKFTPQLSIAAAYATNRRQAFEFGTDIVVTNHDAARWLADNAKLLADFDFLVIDESTAYKNPNAQRSRAVASIIDGFEYRICMTGTFMPNGLIDVWHQVYLVDKGERLGSRFYAFRNTTYTPVPQPGGFTVWEEKPGARDAVIDLLADITIRYKFEECVDIPPNATFTRAVDLKPKHFQEYQTLLKEAILEVESGEIKAINAAVLTQKLLQLISGAVYDSDGRYHVLDTSRYELIAELCAERDHTVVGFIWRHQRDQILDALKQVGIDKDQVGVIDGECKDANKVVTGLQNGDLRVVLAHPASAGHGLTLTKAATLIWASPTYNAEHYEQFNRRIYRTGQERKTETILIAAKDTIEEEVYSRLQGKLKRQFDLLELLQSMAKLQEKVHESNSCDAETAPVTG